MGAANSHSITPCKAPPPSPSKLQSNIPADPRSPSLQFDRTPILDTDADKSSSAPVSPITKNVNLNKECFEKFEKLNLDSPAVRNVLNQFDPRSPALAFQRTPLSFIINNPALLAEYNKSARMKRFDDSTVSAELFDHDNSVTDVEEHKNDSLYRTPAPERIGLLETNLDFIETDIDEARKIRRSMASLKKKSETPIENTERDPRSPSIGIDRTPVVLPVRDEIEKREEEAVSDELDEQVKELEKVNKEMLTRNRSFMNNKNKDSVLIYEDSAETVVTPTIKLNSNIQNGEKTRTPLSCVMNTEKGLSKSRSNTPLSTFDGDSKSSTKSKSNIKSKIPVKIQNSSKRCEMRKTLLDKIPKNEQAYNRRIMDSENSPPIVRKARWDHDKTVVL